MMVTAAAPGRANASNVPLQQDGQPGTSGDAPVTSRDEIFRSQFGFAADPGTIQSAEAAATANTSMQRYGYALTDAELANLDARAAMQPAIGAFAQTVASLPSFAGFYVDQVAGGQLVILSTSPSSLPAVAPPPGTQLTVRTARFSWSELLSLQARIERETQELEDSGLLVASVGLDVVRNAVRLGISNLDSANSEALVSRYGPSLEVVEDSLPGPDACVSRSNCANPLKGGLRIVNVPTGRGCSIGFIETDSGVNTYAMTAAHCSTGTFTHNGVSIGSVTSQSWHQNSSADAEIIDIAESQKSNYVLIELTNWVHTQTTVLAASDYVGEIVCEDSYYWGYNCGRVTDKNLTTSWAQYPGGPANTFVHQRRATFWAHAGDSGGPVVASGSSLNPAEGIYGANFPGHENDSIYAQIELAVEEQTTPHGRLWPCYDMACH